jgi:Glycosyltransferase family 87
MTSMNNFNLRRRLTTLLKRLGDFVGPNWLSLLVIFFVLYASFLYNYGWKLRDTPNKDLPSFYTASVSVFDLGESPYDPEHLGSLMDDNEYVYPYLYPPPSLLFFFPLSLLTYADARQVVLIVNHLLFLILLWAIPLSLLRARPKYDFAVIALCIVYSLAFYPVVVTLEHGQVNILLLFFFVLFWLFAREENAALAALFLALAILLKTYPIIIIPLLLLTRRWRESFYTIAWLGLAVIISFLILPNTVWHDWLVNVFPSGGYMITPAGMYPPAAIWNQNLNGFFARAFAGGEWSDPVWVNPALAKFLTYAAAGIISIVTALAVWRSRIRKDSLDRTMLVALPAIYLIAPFSWEHHLVYLLPSILILLTSRPMFETASKIAFYSLGFTSAFLLGLPIALEFKFYGVIVLWGVCVFTVWKDIELPIHSESLECG